MGRGARSWRRVCGRSPHPSGASAHAWRLLIRGYYRLEIVGDDVRRVAVVSDELERLLLLRGEDRPDVVITKGRASRVEVRLIRAMIE